MQDGWIPLRIGFFAEQRHNFEGAVEPWHGPKGVRCGWTATLIAALKTWQVLLIGAYICLESMSPNDSEIMQTVLMNNLVIALEYHPETIDG